MTKRLYYEDSYLTEFDASVTACEKTDQGFRLSLDRSAFYPTSGGQPFDTGSIDDLRVLDVYTNDQNELWHVVSQSLVIASPVRCKIDWPRRFDHMQQHGGEHILAGALFDLFGGFTHGLHIGEEFSTIDITMPDGRLRLEADECLELENLANNRIQLAAPIKAWFPGTDELNKLPLRKAPAVRQHVRIVAIGRFEMVACGGTHPRSTGEIGLIKILNTAPARGKLRLSFLCGDRALEHYRKLMLEADQAGTALSVPMEDITKAVGKLMREHTSLREELNTLRREHARLKARFLLSCASQLPNGIKLVQAQLKDASELKETVSSLISQDNVIALLSAPNKDQGLRILFARSKNLINDMAELMKHLGIRGGGQSDYAQGATKDSDILQLAEQLIKQTLSQG